MLILKIRELKGADKLPNYMADYLKGIIEVIENDGYVEIVKLQKFNDIDVALLHIRGKDPILSSMYKCTVDTKMLKILHDVLYKKVHYNFGFNNDSLIISKNVGTERFDFNAPTDICNYTSIVSVVPDTPMSFLWKLIVNDFSFFWSGCAPVKCNRIYFSDSGFSVNVNFKNRVGKMQKCELIKFVDGDYFYEDFYVTRNSMVRKIEEDLFNSPEFEPEFLQDDLGRKVKCYKVSLRSLEKNLFNISTFNKMFDNVFTYGVLDTTYNICSYLNGLSLILHDLDNDTELPNIFLPVKSSEQFNIDADKEHNDFNIQSVWYSDNIQLDIAMIYRNNKQTITSYLKSKNGDEREELYNLFMKQCGLKYGKLTHYYVNGLLDALAIQKGDKVTRTKILTGYIRTVNKEFLMYGCYLYNLRMMFIRNNYRISKCFKSSLILSDYNYSYFKVG